MLRPTLLTLLLLITRVLFAQTHLDTLQQRINAMPTGLPDSVAVLKMVDSVTQAFNHSADSLRQQYESKAGSIDKKVARLQFKIDSLQRSNKPALRATKTLDSLKIAKQKLDQEYDGKMRQVKSKTIGKLESMEMTPGMRAEVSAITKDVNAFDIRSMGANPEIPSLSTRLTPGFKGVDIHNPLGGIKAPEEVAAVTKSIGEVKAVTSEVSGLAADGKEIANGNLNEVKHVDQSIEKRATNIEGVKELQEHSNATDEYKSQLEAFKDKEGLKKQAETIVKKEAVNHFAGKEKELEALIQKLERPHVNLSAGERLKAFLKKPNAMKGKPVRDRLYPGVFFQLQIRDHLLLDINPYFGYRISGIFDVGAGWNRRLVLRSDSARSALVVFGPRIFGEARLGKGFTLHVESDWMNVNALKLNSSDEPRRVWVNSLMAGINKRYKIWKNLRGTVLLQYNFHHQHFKTPYFDRLNSRMGFEYDIKSKQ